MMHLIDIKSNDPAKAARDNGHLPLAKHLLWRCHFELNEEYSFYLFRKIDFSTIPSLSSICLNVVAAEFLHGTLRTSSSVSVSSLPSSLFSEICDMLAADAINGYQALVRLQKEISAHGVSENKIPTTAWLDSFYNTEQNTRAFTYQNGGFDMEQPLIDVFAEIDSFVIAAPDQFEEEVTKYLPQPREVGAPSIVGKDQFLRQFDAFTGGFFDDFDFTNTVIIGGSIIASLLPIPAEHSSLSLSDYFNTQSPFKGSDIDIYIYGVDDVAFKAKVTKIYERAKQFTNGKTNILVSDNQIVFVAHYPYRHIQINIVKFRSISNLLTGVDIDCTAIAYDGSKLWALPRARMALNRRWTVTNDDLFQIRGSPNYESRLLKYASRGFTIIDRNMHKWSDNYDTEPTISVYTCYWETSGASLLSCNFKFPEVAESFDEFAASNGVPYGPEKGDKEVEVYLGNIEYQVDSGYGPEDTYLQKVSEDAFYQYHFKLLHEQTNGRDGWYENCVRKYEKKEENYENEENERNERNEENEETAQWNYGNEENEENEENERNEETAQW